LSAGDGLETGTGKLFMKDGTLVFQAKPGVGADDTELVTYVGVDADGKAYTRNVEIRFTDTTGGFSSNDAVDTYYVNTNISSATNSLTEQDNIQLGAGSDLVIMEGFQADNSSNWTINVGGGDNTIILKSAEGKSTASSSSTVNVESGTGNDTIALEAAKYVAYDHSTVTVKGDDGDDSISVTSLGNYIARYHSSVNVGAGDGNDTIALDSPRFLAYYNSTVTVDGGADDDVISLTSRSYIALEDSSVNVLGGDGDDVVSVKSGGYMAGGSSSVNVHGDGGNDTIAIEAVELSGIIMVDGGTGDDLIEMRGGRAHGGVSITGGEGADTFSFGGAELPGNTIRGGIVITDFNAGEGDRLQLKNLLPPDAEENLDQYLSISKYGSNNEDLLLTINKSGQEGGAVTDRLVVRLEGVLADGGSGMDGMADPSIDDLITNNIIILNSGG
jgi:hypothetical protein